ncbi:hypothetical protein [Photobacterium sp. GB-72]|nr:hypothetical protein [Photobacterium sp. GB-72]
MKRYEIEQIIKNAEKGISISFQARQLGLNAKTLHSRINRFKKRVV